ncbi:MAG: hypothetical protein SNH35_01840 [Rikenellaceae bacterium]
MNNDEQQIPNIPQFDPSEFEHNENDYNEPKPENSIRGYQIVISILVVILTALSVLYFNIHRQQMADYDLLTIDRDSIQSNLTELIGEFDELEVQNDSLKLSMEIERHRADSIINQLKRERSFNYAKLKQYEKEVGTLRTIMRGYLQQIDSLNTLNKQLITENVTYRKKISSVELRAELAEEQAQELQNKVRQGSVLKATGITMIPLNSRDREITRVRNAERLRCDFMLAANDLTTPGNKVIYVRITSPDGYILATDALPSFTYEGEQLTYSASREVEYQNQDLGVSIFYTGAGFTAGNYKVELYTEGYLIGVSEVTLR